MSSEQQQRLVVFYCVVNLLLTKAMNRVTKQWQSVEIFWYSVHWVAFEFIVNGFYVWWGFLSVVDAGCPEGLLSSYLILIFQYFLGNFVEPTRQQATRVLTLVYKREQHSSSVSRSWWGPWWDWRLGIQGMTQKYIPDWTLIYQTILTHIHLLRQFIIGDRQYILTCFS